MTIKLVNYTNDEQTAYNVITEIRTNHSMDIDTAINLVGDILLQQDQNGEANVLIDGKWYCYDDIDTIYE